MGCIKGNVTRQRAAARKWRSRTRRSDVVGMSPDGSNKKGWVALEAGLAQAMRARDVSTASGP